MITEPIPSGWILVADDHEFNRELLEECLRNQGYQTIPASDGVTTLRLAQEKKPDLILLDVMMPGMDGYQVCTELKKDPLTRDIPVIFITGLTESDHILRGFAVGGVDYITKPIKMDEVLARTNAWMRIIRLERERELALTEKLKAEHWAAIKAISEGLAHNFNNLLASVMGNLQYLKKGVEDQELKEAVADSLVALEKAKQLVRLMQKYHDFRFEDQAPNLGALIAEVTTRLEEIRSGKRELEIKLEPDLPPLSKGSGPYLEQVLEATLQNAIEATNEGGKITLKAFCQEEDGKKRIVIEIQDTGKGLDEDTALKAFLPFFSTKHTVGVGLGLFAAKLALEQIGGQIELTGSPGAGATVTITLPTARS